MNRCTGKTTRQIKGAPENSTFIWCNSDTSYPKKLARELGRDDIDIRSPMYIEKLMYKGSRRPIVIDHAITSSFINGFGDFIAHAKIHGLIHK